MESAHQEIEFVAAVFERRHLRREMHRILDAVDLLVADLDIEARKTVLMNLRSYLTRLAAELEQAEQAVAAMLPRAAALGAPRVSSATGGRAAETAARGDSVRASGSGVSSAGPGETTGASTLEMFCPNGGDPNSGSDDPGQRENAGAAVQRETRTFRPDDTQPFENTPDKPRGGGAAGGHTGPRMRPETLPSPHAGANEHPSDGGVPSISRGVAALMMEDADRGTHNRSRTGAGAPLGFGVDDLEDEPTVQTRNRDRDPGDCVVREEDLLSLLDASGAAVEAGRPGAGPSGLPGLDCTAADGVGSVYAPGKAPRSNGGA